jgi:hypothetical protein
VTDYDGWKLDYPRHYDNEGGCPECGDELVWEDVSGKGKEFAQVCVNCPHQEEAVSYAERHADSADSQLYAFGGGRYV